MTSAKVAVLPALIVLAVVTACAAERTEAARPTTAATRPPAVPCPSHLPVDGHSADCFGADAPGWHHSARFSPRLRYRIGEQGWIPVHDSLDHFALLGPGGDFVRAGADPVGAITVHRSVYALNRRCAVDGQMGRQMPGVGRSAAAIAGELGSRPGVIRSVPRPVRIGGQTGYVVDLRIDPRWTRHCFFADAPTVPLIGGRPPSDMVHVLQAGFHYRDYFLDHAGSTMAIEIDLAGGDHPDRFDRVVATFRFG